MIYHGVKEELKLYIDKLKKITCPNCPDNKHWDCDIIAEIQISIDKCIPCLPLICNSCGFISFHAISKLGWKKENNIEV